MSNEIRSGCHDYPYHEADTCGGRVIVQSNGHGWFAYRWANPPAGSVLLADENLMTEYQALEWLRGELKTRNK